MKNIISLAKIMVKVDDTTKPIHPVQEMLLQKLQDTPDDYVVKFTDLKQAYPDIADKLKEKLFPNKGTLTVKEIKQNIRDMKVTDDRFWLSETPYKLGVQQKINHPQIAIQLNFTPEMISELKKSPPTYKFLSKMFATKEGSPHPLNNQTFAWARVYKFPKSWVIEEIQSDFIGWESGFKSMTREQQSEFDKFNETEQKEILDFLKNNFDRWEHKFLSTLMQMARKDGVKDIYLFDEEEKEGQKTAPSKLKWFYKNIPKSMGMQKETISLSDTPNKKYKVWKKVLAKLTKMTNLTKVELTNKNKILLAALTRLVGV